MGGGGGRGGRKILDWPEGVFPRRAIGHPLCLPFGQTHRMHWRPEWDSVRQCYSPESFHRRRFGPKGCSPVGPLSKKRIESKEIIQGNKLQEPEDERKTQPDEQPKNQKTNHQPRPPKTVFRPQPIQTTPSVPKSRGRLSKNAKFDTGNQGVK